MYCPVSILENITITEVSEILLHLKVSIDNTTNSSNDYYFSLSINSVSGTSETIEMNEISVFAFKFNIISAIVPKN